MYGDRPLPPLAAQQPRYPRRRDLSRALPRRMAGDHLGNEPKARGPRLLVHLQPRFYPHLSHRPVRKGIGRSTISIKIRRE